MAWLLAHSVKDKSCDLMSEAEPLRSLPVEGVDVLGADVAQQQRGVIRCQGKPTAPSSKRTPEVLQAHHPLHLRVTDPHAIDRRIGSGEGVEVDVLAVSRPVRVTD